MDYMTLAGQAAKKAGLYILSRRGGTYSVEEKFSNHDFVTDVDRESERLIRLFLEQNCPDFGFVGEEENQDEAQMRYHLEHMSPEEYCWIVDPLDGTVNFLRGMPGYSVSIGLCKHSRMIAGAIYVPDADELFLAQEGGGATLNGKPIHVSDGTKLTDAFLTTSLPAVDISARTEAMRHLSGIAMECLNVRMIGSAARAIAYTACGVFDGYWDIGPHPWDMSAGILLLREAGGMVSNYSGAPYSFTDERIVATNGKIHTRLLEMLEK